MVAPRLLLLVYSLFELRVFLKSGLPLFFDAHSHLTRSWLAARALEAGAYPTWTFEWYGGYRLLEFYAPAYYLLTAGLGILAGDVADATKLVLFAGQALSVVAFYAFLLRLGASPLAALFGALLYLHDAERWRVLAVIGNYPSLFLYAVAPLFLLAVSRAPGTIRSSVQLFAASSLVLSAMALGHLTNSLQILPALLAFAVTWQWLGSTRRAAGRAIAALAASLLAFAVVTAFLIVPLLRNLHLVSLSLDAGGIGWDLEPVRIALGWSPGSLRRIFVVTPGALWCAVALCAGGLSLRTRHSRWRACFAGLCVSLLSLAVLGERAAIGLIFFVSPLCVAALEIASRAAQVRGGRAAAVAVQALAVAAVPLWHHARERTPLRYVDPQALAIYERIPPPGDLGRSFDVTPVPDSVDGVYGLSSFSPYWTGRSIPFGGFPQGAPLAVNVQLALVGKLAADLGAPQPELSADALDLLQLLHVEWLVDRHEPARLARLAIDAGTAELREPGLLRLRGASPALFAPRLDRISDATGSDSRAAAASRPPPPAAQWAIDPLEVRGQRSLDVLSRIGTRRDWPLFLPFLQGMRIERARGRADRFFVERTLPSLAPTTAADAGEFAVLAHREHLRSVEILARATAPGFVRLAYSFDPDLVVAVDGEPTGSTADFLGGVVLPFPAGTHAIALEAPRATLRLELLRLSGGIAAVVAILWVWSRLPARSDRRGHSRRG